MTAPRTRHVPRRLRLSRSSDALSAMRVMGILERRIHPLLRVDFSSSSTERGDTTQRMSPQHAATTMPLTHRPESNGKLPYLPSSGGATATGVERIAGTAPDRCANGDHMWGFATDDPEDWFCVRGCGQRLPCRNFAISATGYRIPCVVTGKHHFHEFHSA